MIVKFIILGLYAAMIIVIGLLGLKKTRSFNDFFLGGRKVSAVLTAFTYGTAYFSAVLFIGFAGNIGWNFGLSGLWISLGNALVGTFLVWALIGPAVKKVSVQMDITTMPEFLEKRYNSRVMKFFTSVGIFIFFVPYSAAVFMGLSYLFQSTFNINYSAALLFMGIFTAIYLVLGGYKSMTLIDVIFGIIMTVSVIILLFFIIVKAGGFGGMIEKLNAVNPKLVAPIGPPGLWPLISLVFLTSVAPFGMPQLVQKFYAIKDETAIKKGKWISSVFALLIAGVAYFSGAMTRVFLSPATTPNAFNEAGKPIVDALMPELFANVVPSSLGIAMLLLIFSASMSTLAALILISASSIVKDLYAGFLNPKASDPAVTLLMRIMSAIFIFISVVFAFSKPATIVSILGISWGAVGSVFLGPFIWGLFSKKANEASAIVSSVLGVGTCMVLYILGTPSPQAGTIGMLVSLLSAPAVFLLAPKKN